MTDTEITKALASDGKTHHVRVLGVFPDAAGADVTLVVPADTEPDDREAMVYVLDRDKSILHGVATQRNDVPAIVAKYDTKELEQSMRERWRHNPAIPLLMAHAWLAALFGAEEADRLHREGREHSVKRRAEIDAQMAEKAAKREQAEQDAQAKADQIIREGGRIKADTLVEVARRYDVEVHPRTVGMLRRRIDWVEPHRMAYFGRRMDTETPTALYREVRTAIERKDAEQKP